MKGSPLLTPSRSSRPELWCWRRNTLQQRTRTALYYEQIDKLRAMLPQIKIQVLQGKRQIAISGRVVAWMPFESATLNWNNKEILASLLGTKAADEILRRMA